jgi:hypothetical protein
MLNRPPPDKVLAPAKDQRRALRQRRFRQRQRDGVMVIPVPIDGAAWDALVLSNWAHDGDSKAVIGEGIAAALRTLLAGR